MKTIRFKCKEEFGIYNDFFEEAGKESELLIIQEGSIWEYGHSYGEGEVHLDSVDGERWIELSLEHLRRFFKEMV